MSINSKQDQGKRRFPTKHKEPQYIKVRGYFVWLRKHGQWYMLPDPKPKADADEISAGLRANGHETYVSEKPQPPTGT